MIDNFSILLSHGLLAWALWTLIHRPELDDEAPPEPDAEPEGFAAKRPSANRMSPNEKADRDA